MKLQSFQFYNRLLKKSNTPNNKEFSFNPKNPNNNKNSNFGPL